MRTALCLALSLMLSGTAVMAESGGIGQSDTGRELASNAFADLNGTFIRTYNGLAETNQKATRPILITSGASWELLCEDGSTKVMPAPNTVEMQLKAVSHVCAYLYSIAERHWRSPQDKQWLTLMSEAQSKLDSAIADVDNRKWTSKAWPGQEAKLQAFVRESLTSARDFAAKSVERKDLTVAEFNAFATSYTPTIRATFYLNSLSNAVDAIAVLNQWKQEMGADAWQRLRVIIAAGKGRSTAGFTKETNPAVVVLSSVMSAENIKKNVMMAPAATTNDEALAGLALALTSNKLADAFANNEQATWFYTSLKQPDIPVALEPVRSAVDDLIKGDAKDPVLGLGPKK